MRHAWKSHCNRPKESEKASLITWKPMTFTKTKLCTMKVFWSHSLTSFPATTKRTGLIWRNHIFRVTHNDWIQKSAISNRIRGGLSACVFPHPSNLSERVLVWNKSEVYITPDHSKLIPPANVSYQGFKNGKERKQYLIILKVTLGRP